MIRKKYLAGSGMVMAIAIVWSLAACGGGNHTPGPHEPTRPAPLVQYPQITKVHFRENFGRLFQVDVVAARDGIQYELYKQDVLMEEEPEILTGTFPWEADGWKELLCVLEDNQVNTWKEQGYYLNECYNQQSTLFVECTDVEFVEEGNFFNITDSTAFLGSLHPPEYYGIDENEKKFRSDYDGYLELFVNGEDSSCFWKSYESYGLPKDYNRFRKEFWDLIARNIPAPDWRLKLGDWGRENLYKKYPYMMQKDQERQIRYFSLFENYGYEEKGAPLAASVVYDGGKQKLLYEFRGRVNIYSVGKSGQPVLYSAWGPTAGRGLKAEKEVSGIPQRLPKLMETYQVESWESDIGGTGYVRQGEFYNVENARQDRARKEQILRSECNRLLLQEQVLRSGYDALIHVVYTNGDHVEIRLENGRLPEGYNDFRDELWDYMIPCINEGVAEEKQAADWRDLIDQWGEEYMRER